MSPTTCGDVLERLDDHVDGLLDAAEEAEVLLHLAGCAACGQEEQALRALLRDAAGLAPEIAPPHDLWPGIARRIGPGHGALLRGLAAAAAVLLAVGTLLFARAPARAPGSAALPGAEGDGTGVMREAALQQAAITRLEAEYDEAARGLLVELRARQDRLPPQTMLQVEASLETIDGALADIRAALKVKPSEPTLQLMLASTHRKKIDLLQRVVRVGA